MVTCTEVGQIEALERRIHALETGVTAHSQQIKALADQMASIEVMLCRIDRNLATVAAWINGRLGVET
jgi:hypothetical protein